MPPDSAAAEQPVGLLGRLHSVAERLEHRQRTEDRLIAALKAVVEVSGDRQRAIGLERLAKSLDTSRDSIERWNQLGLLGPEIRTVLGRRLVVVEELDAWLRMGMPPRPEFRARVEQEQRSTRRGSRAAG